MCGGGHLEFNNIGISWNYRTYTRNPPLPFTILQMLTICHEILKSKHLTNENKPLQVESFHIKIMPSWLFKVLIFGWSYWVDSCYFISILSCPVTEAIDQPHPNTLLDNFWYATHPNSDTNCLRKRRLSFPNT